MSSTSNGASDSGVNIALAGLAFQVFTLVVFIAAAVDYAILSRSVWRAQELPRKFLVFIGFLSAATILILIRCCYVSQPLSSSSMTTFTDDSQRVFELSEGYSRTSEALRDQPLFIGLEGV